MLTVLGMFNATLLGASRVPFVLAEDGYMPAAVTRVHPKWGTPWVAIVTIGTIAGSFFAHTHEYPGRMSVHVVPFAVAVAVSAAAQLARAISRRRDPAFTRAASPVEPSFQSRRVRAS